MNLFGLFVLYSKSMQICRMCLEYLQWFFSGSFSGGSCYCSSGPLSGSCAGALPNAAVGLHLGGLREVLPAVLVSVYWVSFLDGCWHPFYVQLVDFLDLGQLVMQLVVCQVPVKKKRKKIVNLYCFKKWCHMSVYFIS